MEDLKLRSDSVKEEDEGEEGVKKVAENKQAKKEYLISLKFKNKIKLTKK